MCNALCYGQHRKHKLGMTFLTSPPYYSCIYCNREISPIEYLPKVYSEMKIPMKLDTLRLFMNGYYIFVDSLKKKGINDYEYFMDRWNESDTSCISSEIASHKSEDIGAKWLATHKPGIYWLNEEDWMSTKGFIGHKSKDSNYAMGGRFSDEVLKADKWYKIVYNLTSPLIQ